MAFIISIFQFHCKSGYKQVKGNKIKRGICKSDNISPYLESGKLFKWILNFIS